MKLDIVNSVYYKHKFDLGYLGIDIKCKTYDILIIYKR